MCVAVVYFGLRLCLGCRAREGFLSCFTGQLNSLETQDMEYEFVKDPWSTQNTIERPYLRRERLEKEDEAAFPLNAPMPRYLSFVSPNPNRWEHPRSYRIQIISFAGKHLPTSSSMERSISWGRWVPGLGSVWPQLLLLLVEGDCHLWAGLHQAAGKG